MAANQPNISVIEPISPAIERVRTILFEPFELCKWFVIGFCAWLAHLGTGGGNPNFNAFYRKPYADHQPGEMLGQAKVFVDENLAYVIFAAVAVVILITILWLVFTWLSSRGRFMFLHCVAENKAEVKVPWSKFRQHANSLFLFRVVVGLIGIVVVGLFFVPCLFLGVVIAKSSIAPTLTALSLVVMLVVVILAITIAFALVQKFTTDFVVPIMFLRTTSCVQGWREFLALLSANKGRFILYILFQIVIAIAIGMILLVITLATCCCAGCFLAIPYISTVLMLPLLIFKRGYSLCYLSQFGPGFDVFAQEATVP